MSRLFSILVALLLAAPPGLLAQPPESRSVSVQVLNNRVAVGEFGQIFIVIRNGDSRMPERIDVEGLEVVYSGNRFVGSSRAVETTHYYRYRGYQPGTFTIPEFEIRVGNRVEKVGPIDLQIVERSAEEALDATKPYFAKLELPRDTFYAGELVPFTLAAYIRGRNSIHEVASAKLENESFVIKGFREVRTDGAEVGGVYYSSATIPSHLFALKSGSFRLGPAEIAVRALDSESGFGSLAPLFQRTTTREMVSNTVNLTIKPLPDGAPASFTGGIGRFALSATPSTTSLGVGDPVSLEFEVKGVGNLRTMGAPVFAIPQTGIWKSYEPNKTLDDAEDSDGFREGRARFSRVILPEARTETIPEFHLTYFDPAEEQYVTLKTDPIPITVSQDRSPAPPATVSFPAGETAPPATARRPEPGFPDILHIRSGPLRSIAAGSLGRPGPLFWVAQALCSIVLCTVLGFGLFRWIKLAKTGRHQPSAPLPFAAALKRIPTAGTPRRDFFHAIATALEAWKREHPAAPPQALVAVTRVLQRCDAVLYSGQSESGQPVSAAEVEEFRSLLHRLPPR